MYSQAIKNIERRISSSVLTCAVAAVALTAQSPPPVPPLAQILKHHVAALDALHVKEPKTHEIVGTIDGLNLHGIFHEWQDGTSQRRDETLGLRTQRVLRVGNRLWMQSTSGDIREIHGLVSRRQVTEDFIDSEAFAAHPEAVGYLDRATLPDGRDVYDLRITPRNGEEFVVSIDTKSYLIDRKAYVDGDTNIMSTYADYRVVNGLLLPYTETDSNGDTKYDITSHVTNVRVDTPIAQSVFAPLQPLVVENAAPVTLPIIYQAGLLFARVTIGGKPYQFLLDSGAQGIVFDPHVARELNLTPQGALEVRGAERVAAQGIIETPDINIGGATLPAHVTAHQPALILCAQTSDGRDAVGMQTINAPRAARLFDHQASLLEQPQMPRHGGSTDG